MSELAIRVEHLGKQYKLGGRQASYSTFRETVVEVARAPLRWLKGDRKSEQNKFWALDDVSFEVKQGEAVGIIGRNGAGKSTLLKILSRITSPTRGRVDIYGRVGSLLEVGTGFHPELSGRENIFLNGAILGMSRVEIMRKFDEIVAFAEIEKFLDTPVKFYSSGMYVRLAFAVAAHLEPEILVVDEVLAVGDAAFQKKCLGKMGDETRKGRTVLFVSHNMTAISRLCNRSILMESGKFMEDGLSAGIVAKYINSNVVNETLFSQPPNFNIPLCLLEAEVFSENQVKASAFSRHESITVRIKYQVNREISSVHIYSSIFTNDELMVLGTGDADIQPSRFGLRKPGIYTCQYQIPARTLNVGGYSVSFTLGIPYQQSFQVTPDNALTFRVIDVERTKGLILQQRKGIVWFDLPWKYIGDDPFMENK
jgi:lipopolysaccharide transport system ATP-binding protein